MQERRSELSQPVSGPARGVRLRILSGRCRVLAWLLLLGLGSRLVTAQPVPLARQWSRIWGSATNEQGFGVAVDLAANTYVAGFTQGDFDGQTRPGAESIVLSKHDAEGKRLWTRLWGPTNDARGYAVGVDKGGAVYVLGQTGGPMLGQPAVGNGDFFLTKVTPTGGHVWTRVWGSVSSDAGLGLALDGVTNLYVAGYTSGSLDNQTNSGGRDVCVSKLDASGSRTWTRQWGSNGDDSGQGVAVDAQGNVYVCGYAGGAFDGETFHGSRDICLTKFNASGLKQWTRLWGSPGADEGCGVAVDSAGFVYVTGFGGSFNGQSAVGDSDPFLIKVSPAGAVLWTRLWGSPAADAGYDVTVGPDGRVYVVGRAANATFDGLGPPGALFLTCFSAEGSKLWTRRWGLPVGEARSVALAGSNDVFAAGSTYGGFDGQTTVGGLDLFLSRWGAEPPPKITEGPTALTVTEATATIQWKTDKPANSAVQYSRFQGSWEGSVTNAALVQDHTVILSNLMAGSTYRYVVHSADAYGQNVSSAEQGFTTPALSAVSNLCVLGDMWPRELQVDAAPNVDRVEFRLDNILVGTAYGPPFQFYLSPSALGVAPSALVGLHHITATAFDPLDRTLGISGVTMNCLPWDTNTYLEICRPPWDYRLFTTNTVSTGDTLDITVWAYRFEEEFELAPPWAPPGTPPVILVRRRLPVNEVYFYLDGTLVHTSTEGLALDHEIHVFAYVTTNLALGRHRVEVKTDAPPGCLPASEARDFDVVLSRADVALGREVIRHSNQFQVTLYVTNVGRGLIYLDRLVDHVTGFQPCAFSSSARWFGTTTFSYLDRQNVLTIGFGSECTLEPGATLTFSYMAVPILFVGDCAYSIGRTTRVDYRNPLNHSFTEEFTEPVVLVGPPGARVRLGAAVEAALNSSDYLLVTSPPGLERTYSATGAVAVLTLMAELASLRGGVLGYYHAAGAMRSDFRAGDVVAAGDLFRNDSLEELYVGRLATRKVHCYARENELTVDTNQLPIACDFLAGDALAVGNVRPTNLAGAPHRRPEVLVAFGDEHPYLQAGRLVTYQYEYDPTNGLRQFTAFTNLLGFATGCALAVGEVRLDDNPPRDEIILAKTDGDIIVVSGGCSFLCDFRSDYSAGDLFGVGNLRGDEAVEMVVGDLSHDRLLIYRNMSRTADFDYRLDAELSVTLDPEDDLAVGDVLGDELAEIIVADASEDRITIYGYNSTTSNYEVVATVAFAYEADDEILAAWFTSRTKKQLLVLRGSGGAHRFEGSVEIIADFGAESPGDRWALDNLLNTGAAWAAQLATNWTRDGYLLLVGENEILPTFRKSWDLSGVDGGNVDYTDRNYASTDSWTDNNVPELAVGRIVGNSLERLCQALRTACDLARTPSLLNNSLGYCVSGSDPDEEHKFAPLRESIAGKLRDRGFLVTEQHAPSGPDFRSQSLDQDVIFLTPHGSAWGTCGLQGDDLPTYRLGEARPLTYAASCLTGRYPDGNGTFGEQFLWNHAATYIGATEVTYHYWTDGLTVRGWDPRMAEAFFDRLEAGRPVGRSLTLAKQHRLTDAANTYSWDWNMNRYHCAIYHLFGDPKLQVQFGADLKALARQTAGDGVTPNPTHPGPLHQLTFQVPLFVVITNPGGHHVDIPGQEHITVPGKPAVPFYAESVHFPKGCVVQGVTLQNRSGLRTVPGLRLPPVVPYRGAQAALLNPAGQPTGWWPDRDFDWSVSKKADGSSVLAVKAYAFFYNSDTQESRFYSNYLFGITYAWSPLTITRLTTDKRVYPRGAPVKADLYLCQTNPQPLDVLAEARVFQDDDMLVDQLPTRTLRGLQGWGFCRLQWQNPQFTSGDYALEVIVRDPQGTELDRARTEFQLGQAGGRIGRFDMNPRYFRRGDTVDLAATFDNTGSTSLDGELIILLQDAAGNPVAELRRTFRQVAAGASFRLETNWVASLVPRDCVALVYAQFGGQTTALSVGAHWTSAPLRWDSLTADTNAVCLRWPSVSGRHYNVYYTTNLAQIPFSCLASNLPATPPQNTHVHAPPAAQGFYRLQEVW